MGIQLRLDIPVPSQVEGSTDNVRRAAVRASHFRSHIKSLINGTYASEQDLDVGYPNYEYLEMGEFDQLPTLPSNQVKTT